MGRVEIVSSVKSYDYDTLPSQVPIRKMNVKVQRK